MTLDPCIKHVALPKTIASQYPSPIFQSPDFLAQGRPLFGGICLSSNSSDFEEKMHGQIAQDKTDEEEAKKKKNLYLSTNTFLSNEKRAKPLSSCDRALSYIFTLSHVELLCILIRNATSCLVQRRVIVGSLWNEWLAKLVCVCYTADENVWMGLMKCGIR